MKNLTEWNISTAKSTKHAEIENGLDKIQNLENQIILLAEVRAKRLLISKSVQEIDQEINGLKSLMFRETRNNLQLQKVWTNRQQQAV